MVFTSIFFGFLIIVVFFIKYSKKEEPKKIFGIYSQPGKWYFVKYHIFLLILFLRRIKYYLFGKSLFHKEADLEKPQPLSDHKLAFDAVFFQAVSQKGIYVCAGTERRHEAKINGLFYLVLPEYGVLASEKLPKTKLNADPAALFSLKSFAAEGISFTPVVPMKWWNISFKGKMRQLNNSGKFVNVELKAEWKSDYPWTLFEIDLPSKILARAIATEPWTGELFKSLKEAHQSHYEQMGYLDGEIKIDDKTIPLVELDAFRDHSFGHKRDWSLMHRYIFHMFYLADRTKISVGVVCQPCTSSRLEMGFITHPNGKVEGIESCDLLLYQHAENGVLNKELCFTFMANGITYEAKVKYEYDAVHYVGNDTEAKMNERFLTCEINGITGRGISEWHYNNINK